MMNKKHFIIGLILLFSASSYGQVQNNMNRLVTQCGKIVEYSQQITELKDSINDANQKIKELRNTWEKTCNEYLASEEQTLDDFQYLINNTDSIYEKELYLKLVDASKKVRDKGKKKELRPVDDTKPVIKEEPVPVKSDNDGKEKEDNKKDKNKDDKKNDNPTPPAKKTKGDMDDEIKSKIVNKGKK